MYIFFTTVDYYIFCVKLGFSASSPPAFTNTKKKLISLHLSCNLASLPSLEHCPNIPVSYPCFIPRIHDRICRLLVFLLALAQKRRPATKRSRRVTDVNRGSNVLRFCKKLIFTGVGYQPPAQPLTWRARGSHFVSSLPFDLFGMGSPTRSTRLQPTWL